MRIRTGKGNGGLGSETLGINTRPFLFVDADPGKRFRCGEYVSHVLHLGIQPADHDAHSHGIGTGARPSIDWLIEVLDGRLAPDLIIKPVGGKPSGTYRVAEGVTVVFEGVPQEGLIDLLPIAHLTGPVTILEEDDR